ncbi:cytochrome P450 4C1-like isoform X4 [Spodoptera frugiperda]|uniref:Cytochrome P450 4C1-like isoform X4 n=1 Tax=Spodoptera frugiperda TaxID=7108 RepID=A0A9R0DVQ4_SPOFR|nr:cytochrome P450 4C1-like isoform X4 [Spodoptera frugiperda]
MSLLVLIVIYSVLFAIWWYWCRPRVRSPAPYPGALPIIGHIHVAFKYRNDVWSFLERLFNCVTNECVVLKMGSHNMYVVSDPDEVGVIANTSLKKSYHYSFLDNILENGLLLEDVPTWRIHRKLLNPAFNLHTLNTFQNIMNVEARSLVSQLKDKAGKEPVDVKELVVKYILRSVCRTSLGLEAKDQDMIDKEYAEAIEEIMDIAVKRALNVALYPSFIFKRTAKGKREQELIMRIKNILNRTIQKRKSDLKTIDNKQNNKTDVSDGSANGKFKPILDLMLHLSDEQEGFSDDDIRQHLNTFVFASYDTTSGVLQTVLSVLGSRPDVQERVYKEIVEVFGDNEELTKYDLPKLVYLEAVIKEVLRLYPIVPWVGRQIDTDIVFPKYTLRAGSTCILVIYNLHRHPSWGPDAKEFKPERWLNPATLPTNPNVYAPFGIGKRNCIGKRYAMMTLKTSVAHIVRNFQLSADISNLSWNFEVVLKPSKPILVSFTLRP